MYMKYVIFIFICLMLGNIANATKRKLYVYDAGNYISTQAISDGEQECNIDLIQNFFDDPSEMLAKIVAGADAYDVIIGTGYAIEDLNKLHKLYNFSAIDKSSLSNLKQVDKKYLNQGFDSQNSFSLPYAYTVSMVGYNVKKLRELNITAQQIHSWKIIFDPQILKSLKGHISVFDSSRNVFGAALLYLGKNPNSTNESDLRLAQKVIQQANKFWTKFDSANYITGLANEQLWVAMSYSSDLYKTIGEIEKSKTLMTKKELANAVELDGATQMEGNLIELDNMVIPAKSPNKDIAKCFINAMYKPLNAASIANQTGSTVPNLGAKKLINKKVNESNWITPTAANKIYSFVAYPPVVRRNIAEKWIEIKMDSGE